MSSASSSVKDAYEANVFFSESLDFIVSTSSKISFFYGLNKLKIEGMAGTILTDFASESL